MSSLIASSLALYLPGKHSLPSPIPDLLLSEEVLSSEEFLSFPFDTASSSYRVPLPLKWTNGPLADTVTSQVVDRSFKDLFAEAASRLDCEEDPTRLARDVKRLTYLSSPQSSLTTLALIYGPNSSMTAHTDSPTKRITYDEKLGRTIVSEIRSEWLAMINFGADCIFSLDGVEIRVEEGGAVVFDGCRVLHGVERIEGCGKVKGLKPGWRFGVLCWEAAAEQKPSDVSSEEDEGMSGFGGLFGPDSSDEDTV